MTYSGKVDDEHIVEYHEKIYQTIEDFKQTKTIEELIEKNKLFLKGELIATCYHGGPLNPESNLIYDKLIKINDLGMITTCSQPGLINVAYNEDPNEEDVYYEQKCFVVGYIEKFKFPAFSNKVTELMKDELFLSFPHSLTDEHKKELIEKDLYYVTRYVGNLGCGNTHIFNGSMYCFKKCKFIADKFYDKYIGIELVDKVWQRKDKLLDCIIIALEEVNKQSNISFMLNNLI